MKLVLLPGLDGTGVLFEPFVSHLQKLDIQIIPLPMQGPQDYDTLTRYVASKLPDEPFTLLAESFSGPIAANLISSGQFKIKRVIFVATFLTSPRPFTLKLIEHFPLKRLMRIRFSDYFVKLFLLGNHTDKTLLDDVKHVIDLVPDLILKRRIASIKRLKPLRFKSAMETLFLCPTHDRLIPKKSIDYFTINFKHIDIKSISGPHFILQTNPKDCIDKLKAFLSIK